MTSTGKPLYNVVKLQLFNTELEIETRNYNNKNILQIELERAKRSAAWS